MSDTNAAREERDDYTLARGSGVTICEAPDCRCPGIRFDFTDGDGLAFAGAQMTPADAREIAVGLLKAADLVERMKARHAQRRAVDAKGSA